MSLLSTVADSLAQVLRRDAAPDRDPAAVERIRREMLKLLPPQGRCCEGDRVRRRLSVATDARSLWFLRTHLHQQLSRSCGETLAMHKVHALWPLFANTIPPALLGKRPPQVDLSGDTKLGFGARSQAVRVTASLEIARPASFARR